MMLVRDVDESLPDWCYYRLEYGGTNEDSIATGGIYLPPTVDPRDVVRAMKGELQKEIARLRDSHESLLDMKAEATRLLTEVEHWKRVAHECDIRACQEKGQRHASEEKMGFEIEQLQKQLKETETRP